MAEDDPVTATLIAAAGAQALSSVMGGIQKSAEFSSQEKAAEYNAHVDYQQAKIAGEVGASKEAIQRRTNAANLGEQGAAIAESGVGVTSGSAQSVMRESATSAELDALNVRYEGQLQRHAALSQAALDEYSAKVAGYNKNAALYGGFVGAGTSLLSSAGNYAAMSKFGASAGSSGGSTH